jgi:hypothetical protein
MPDIRSLFGKFSIFDVNEDDLLSLISRGVQEQKILDYKRDLPGNSDNDKKEFLADVSSFANTVGGFLIYGIAETQGVAVDIAGINGLDPDNEKLRLDQIIREGIEPRLPELDIHSVKLKNGNDILVIQIPQSHIAPHMVAFKSASRFYARQSNGKYLLDVQQLRDAFLLSAAVSDRIRDFRLARISRLGANETPVKLEDGSAKLIVHVIPSVSFSAALAIDIALVGNPYQKFFPETTKHRYNIDGVVFSNEIRENQARKYFQVFRNGIVEFVHGNLIDTDEKKWRSFEADWDAIQAAHAALLFQRSLNIGFPVFIFISITGVRDLVLEHSTRNYDHTPTFDRNTILIPDVMLDIYPENDELEILLKPALDSIWNAGGLPRSESYNRQGHWSQR